MPETTNLNIPADTSVASTGSLKVNVLSAQDEHPLSDATIDISLTSDPQNVIEEVHTNPGGSVLIPDLPAPPIEYSEEPSAEKPYSDVYII